MAVSQKLGSELTRKGIHILIAFTPFIAAYSRSGTALFLMLGTFVYVWAESLRFLGFSLPFISSVTKAVLRTREKDNFALGPVTLGLGALLVLILFPAPVAAAAIYALAFGDSAATLTGMFLGRIRPSFLRGKSIEGSLACFAVSAIAAFLVFRDIKIAVAAGLAAMLVDVLPVGDFDNILLPLFAGLAIMISMRT